MTQPELVIDLVKAEMRTINHFSLGGKSLKQARDYNTLAAWLAGAEAKAVVPTEPFADPSKEELKAAPIEIGWLIEKIVDDRPQWLTCAWTFGWTDDAGNAIRFCRRDDAEQIATMMENDDIRITEHQWS